MEFYRNSYGEEMGKDTFMSLQSLMKNNDGLWKSEKQGKFFLAKKTVEESWIEKQIEVKEGHKFIMVDGFFNISHGRGHRPVTYYYEVDYAGVVARHRVRYQGDINKGGCSPKSVEIDWERTVEVAPKAPELAPEAPKEVPESNWFGEVGKRYNDLKLTVKFVTGFETQFGYSYLNKMEDAEGNQFVWFSSNCLEEGTTYTMNGTVKEHSEFREVKQTVLTRCMKVKEVA